MIFTRKRERELTAEVAWLRAQNAALNRALDEIVHNSFEELQEEKSRCETFHAGVAAGVVIPLPRLRMVDCNRTGGDYA